jgi:hypothetical protein
MRFINLTRKIARWTCSSVRGSNEPSKPIRFKKIHSHLININKHLEKNCWFENWIFKNFFLKIYGSQMDYSTYIYTHDRTHYRKFNNKNGGVKRVYELKIVNVFNILYLLIMMPSLYLPFRLQGVIINCKIQDSNILLKSHFLHIYILCTITSYGIKYIFNAFKTILK